MDKIGKLMLYNTKDYLRSHVRVFLCDLIIVRYLDYKRTIEITKKRNLHGE